MQVRRQGVCLGGGGQNVSRRRALHQPWNSHSAGGGGPPTHFFFFTENFWGKIITGIIIITVRDWADF